VQRGRQAYPPPSRSLTVSACTACKSSCSCRRSAAATAPHLTQKRGTEREQRNARPNDAHTHARGCIERARSRVLLLLLLHDSAPRLRAMLPHARENLSAGISPRSSACVGEGG
jgi:hypothetical protein